MNKRLIALCITLSMFADGCASWRDQFMADPLAAILRGVSYASNAVSLADLAFNGWAAMNPTAATPEVRSQFTAIAGNVRSALALTQGVTRVASDLTTGPVDRAAALRDGQAALVQLSDFLSGLATPPGQAADPLMARAIAATRAASVSP
jgi:hypothetical protein